MCTGLCDGHRRFCSIQLHRSMGCLSLQDRAEGRMRHERYVIIPCSGDPVHAGDPKKSAASNARPAMLQRMLLRRSAVARRSASGARAGAQGGRAAHDARPPGHRGVLRRRRRRASDGHNHGGACKSPPAPAATLLPAPASGPQARRVGSNLFAVLSGPGSHRRMAGLTAGTRAPLHSLTRLQCGRFWIDRAGGVRGRGV